MHFAGVLPEDAPDPRVEAQQRLRAVPFPVMGLVEQPTIEDSGQPGLMESTDLSGRFDLSVSLTYRLWRNPVDRTDPVNLVELDDRTRAALDEVPPWPRPGWLIEMAEESRYPHLWEAVRTTWSREPSEHSTPARQLVEHANYILMNQFRDELGLSVGPPEDRGWMISEGAVRGASVIVDGSVTPAIEIDTDPFIYAIGFALSVDVNVTVALPRSDRPRVHLALARHAAR